MTAYMPRSAWTDQPRGGALQDGAELVGLVAHYTGTAHTYGSRPAREVAQILRNIRRYHVEHNGWADTGYTACVDQDGRVWDLRGITRVPAAHASARNPRANWHRSAVLFLVGIGEEPSPEAVEAFRDFRHRVWLPRWPLAVDLLGHQDVPGAATACPGEVEDLVRDGDLLRPPDGRLAPAPAPRPAPGTSAPWQERIIAGMDTVDLSKVTNDSATWKRGADVKRLQGLVMAAGYGPQGLVDRDDLPDGIAGPRTRVLLGAVQERYDTGRPDRPAVPDYVAGPATWGALLGS